MQADTLSSSNDNPVQQAYVATLEAQVGSLREELSSLYKTQAQNAQRLVHLTEQLHASAEKHAQEHSEVIQLRAERATREREREEAAQLRREKDKNIETLQDELHMLTLEFEQLESRNEALKEDNSSLLRRWLEKKAQEAAEMDRMVAESERAAKNGTKAEGAAEKAA
jgi:autophagy-related protein 16